MTSRGCSIFNCRWAPHSAWKFHFGRNHAHVDLSYAKKRKLPSTKKTCKLSRMHKVTHIVGLAENTRGIARLLDFEYRWTPIGAWKLHFGQTHAHLDVSYAKKRKLPHTKKNMENYRELNAHCRPRGKYAWHRAVVRFSIAGELLVAQRGERRRDCGSWAWRVSTWTTPSDLCRLEFAERQTDSKTRNANKVPVDLVHVILLSTHMQVVHELL